MLSQFNQNRSPRAHRSPSRSRSNDPDPFPLLLLLPQKRTKKIILNLRKVDREEEKKNQRPILTIHLGRADLVLLISDFDPSLLFLRNVDCFFLRHSELVIGYYSFTRWLLLLLEPVLITITSSNFCWSETVVRFFTQIVILHLLPPIDLVYFCRYDLLLVWRIEDLSFWIFHLLMMWSFHQLRLLISDRELRDYFPHLWIYTLYS